MLVTLDTSVVMAVLLEEPSKKGIIAKTQGADLQAPPSLFWEVGNALSSLMRRSLLDAQAALVAITAFESIPIRFAEVDLDSVIRLVDLHSMWAYDAYVIQCAKKYRTPLLSLDQAQCRIAAAEGVDVWEINL